MERKQPGFQDDSSGGISKNRWELWRVEDGCLLSSIQACGVSLSFRVMCWFTVVRVSTTLFIYYSSIVLPMKSQCCEISFRYINPYDMSFWCTKCSLSFRVMCWLLVSLDVCSELILWVMSLHSLLSKCNFKESVSSTGDELQLPPVPFEHSLLVSTDTTIDEHKAGWLFTCVSPADSHAFSRVFVWRGSWKWRTCL